MHAALKTLLRPLLNPTRAVLQRLGYDLAKYAGAGTGPSAEDDPRAHWIEKLKIDLMLDVGANEGQYVGWTRDRGYRGRVISFEPQAQAFAACEARWGSDPNWRGIKTALGESAGEFTLHVAGNSMSSSLRPMLQSHVKALPESAIVCEEVVPVCRLDEAVEPYLGDATSVYLKIDTQGSELQVLRGAGAVLDRVTIVELELSLVPLYSGQELLPEIWREVESLGFEPIWMEPGFCDSTECRMLQVDALFTARSAGQNGRTAQKERNS